ncbi:MAG: tetratricopeptide repeat protein [Chitinophagaceae bacterium]|nr:tetratricopeptide repeat protein [Chitinophagaceae bacterium]
MRRSKKILIPALVIAVLFLAACSGNENKSPYSGILSQQPFASLTDSISKEPQRDNLYFQRAVLLNKNNFPEPALADFRQAWSLKKNEQYALGISSILLDKKPDSAVAFLNSALEDLPNSVFLRLSLAKAYRVLNKISNALNVCNEILKTDPKQMDALMLKADLQDQQNDTAAAIATLEQAYAINPDIEELDYNLAFKYASTKNPKTLAFCDMLLKKDSLKTHAEPLYFKAVYYENTGDPNKALELLDQSIIRDYTFIDAYMNKGKILYDQKKYNAAVKVYRMALNIQSTYADAYYWLGKSLEAMGRKDDALMNYERAYGLDKTLTEAKDAANKLK